MAVLVAAVLIVLVLAPTDARAAKPNLTGTVWTDTDRDGSRDQGEPGRAGVRVELLFARKRNVEPATIVRSVETDGSGVYRARIRGRGFYRARVLLPGSAEGFTGTDLPGDDSIDSDVATSGKAIGKTPRVKLRRGKPSRTFDAGLLPITVPDPDVPTIEPEPDQVASIGEFIWRDADADGIQDPAETGLAGIQVELWNAEKTKVLAVTHTNSAGFWALPAIAGTEVRVRVVSPDPISPPNQGLDEALDSDINASGPDAGFSDVMTASGSTADVDAGLYLAVGDLVWDDTNLNGIRDGGEPGLTGVTVQLWNAAKTNLFRTAFTDSSGAYQFIVPAAGDYRVRVLLPTPASQVYSPKDIGDDTLDSDINPTGPDAGFTDPLSINAGLITTVDGGLH